MAEQLDNTTIDDNEQLIKIEEGEIVPDLNTDAAEETEPSGNVNVKLSGPAREAGFLLPESQIQIDKDIEERQTIKPVVSFDELMSNENAEIPKNIKPEDLEKARLFKKITDDNVTTSPDLKQNLYNVYKKVNADLKLAQDIAKANVPEFRAFGVTSTGEVADEFKNDELISFPSIPTSKRRLAENRSRLVNFGERTGIAKRSPEAFSVVTEHFTTGDSWKNFVKDNQDLVSGGLSLYKILESAGVDYAQAFGKAVNQTRTGDEGVFDLASQFFREKRTERRTEIGLFMNGFQDNKFLADSTGRLNTFIKEKYTEQYGEDAYKEKQQALTLSPQDARALYNFASAESGFLETFITDLAFNVGTRVGFKKVFQGIGAIFGSKTPQKFVLDQKRKKANFPKNKDGINPYAQTSVAKFTELEANQFKRDGLFKYLVNAVTFKKARQIGKVKQGDAILGDVTYMKNIDPKYKTMLDDAYKKVENASSPVAKEQALKELDIAENAYLKATSSRIPFAPGNRFAEPAPVLQDMIGDDLIPTFAQSAAYNWWTSGEPNMQDLENANLVSAAAYLAPAVMLIPARMLSRLGGKLIPATADVSFAVKGMIDNTNLLQRVGLRKLLDEDITSLRFPDGKGNLVKPTIEQYRSLQVMKNLFLRLDTSAQQTLLKNSLNINNDIESSLQVIRNPKLRELLRDKLRMSYAQLSSIAWYQGISKNFLTKLSLRDITKVTQKFNTALRAYNSAQELTTAQNLLLSEINSEFINQARNGKLNSAEQSSMQGILNLQAGIAKSITGSLEQDRALINLTADEIGMMLRDPKEFMSISPSQLDDVLDSRIKNTPLPKMEGNELAILTPKGNRIAPNFFQPNMNAIDEIGKIHLDAMKGLENANQMLSHKRGEIPDYKFIMKSLKQHYTILDNYYSNIGNQIYEPLRSFGTVEATETYQSLIDLYKRANVSDIASDDIKLTAFQPQKSYANSPKGKEITRIMNDIARDALKRTFINKHGETADIMFEEFIEASKNIIGEAYGFERTVGGVVKQNPSMLHYYDYFLQRGGIINDEPLAKVRVDFADLARLRRELFETSRAFKKSDKSTIRNKAREYAELGDKIEGVMKEKGTALEVETDGSYLEKVISNTGVETVVKRNTTNAYKESVKMNVLYGVIVGQRKQKDSMLEQFRILNDVNSKAAQKKTALDKLLGKDLFDAMISKDSDLRLEAAIKFRTRIEEAFGIPVIPDSLTEPIDGIGYSLGNRVLRNDIDFLAKIPSDDVNAPSMTYRQFLEQNIRYVLDDSTPTGKIGIALADTSVQQMFKYMPFHRNLLNDLGEQLLSKKAYKQGATSIDDIQSGTFISDPLNGNTYKDELQEALTFNTPNGSRPIRSVDSYMIRTEADLGHLIEKSTKAQKLIKGHFENLTRAARKDRDKYLAETRAAEAFQSETLRTLNLSDPDKFINRYTKGLNPAITGIDEEFFQRYVADYNLVKNANPNVPEESIKAVFANLLMQGILGKGEMKAVTVKKLAEQTLEGKSTETQIMVMQNPAEALLLMENPNMKKMFEYVGIDEQHLESLKGVMRMIAREAQYRKDSLAVSLPNLEFTDGNVISRAFNWVRGLIGTEFILADAGFRMLRDNDLQVFNMMLNDKDQSEFVFKVIQGTQEITSKEIKTFVDRLDAFLIRELVNELSFEGDEESQKAVLENLTNDNITEQGEPNESIQ